MATLPYTLSLYNSVKRGSSLIGNITKSAINWRRSIRRVGGFWMGSFEYGANRGERDDFFLDGLMREVRETSGAIINWQGFIGDMDYTRDGVTWRRSIMDRANRIKCLFTRQYDNILTNGSAESGAWTVFNGATVTQDTAWVADGTYSCKIVVADTTIRGATIQSGIILAADTTYLFMISVYVPGAGSWRIQINKTSDDTKVVATSTRGAQGVQSFTLTISPNTYVGSVYVRITSEASAGTIYADAAVLQIAPQSADTGWSSDTASVSEFGNLEKILLEGGLSYQAAQAKVTTALAREAWPRLLPPDTYGPTSSGSEKLVITCYGYVHTLAWKYCTYAGTAAMSSIIASLLSGLDYVTTGIVETNSTSYTVEPQAQITTWQVLKTLAHSGDASGNLYSLGVYANRKLNYESLSTNVLYNMRRGKLYQTAGGEMEPWLLQPGWMSLSDAQIVPSSITASKNDISTHALLEEVEFVAPNSYTLRSNVSD